MLVTPNSYQDSSDEERSPDRHRHRDEEEEDMEVSVKEDVEEDIPLTKAGYSITPSYPPIQVHLLVVLCIYV